jgi:hypothetical protein
VCVTYLQIEHAWRRCLGDVLAIGDLEQRVELLPGKENVSKISSVSRRDEILSMDKLWISGMFHSLASPPVKCFHAQSLDMIVRLLFL